MTDAELTIAALRVHGWEVVKLRPRDKRPDGAAWECTRDPETVATWLRRGHNIGLVCHERTGVAVLDPDKPEWADMIDTLGQPSLPWVITGSGRLHYYVRWEPHFPAKIEWKGEIIGEVQRGPGQQQVVMPPSVHPDTGLRYTWITAALDVLCEPIHPVTDPLPRLPALWLGYLRHDHFMREHWKRERGH
ncbi:MAG: bifunctional DNA primase/polymerase [Chloroflexota bacterium]